MLTERNLQKLIDEGFVRGDATKLEIVGSLYANMDTVYVYGGGIYMPNTELTFDRTGRKQTLSCDLCELLESWRFKVNNQKVKITVEVVEEG